MKTKSAKTKGYRLEKWIVDQLQSLGILARKQPGSGIYQDFPHDVYADIPGFGPLIVEAKSWKHGWRTGDNAMAGADILVIRADRSDPKVYMTWNTFSSLIKTIEELREEASV